MPRHLITLSPCSLKDHLREKAEFLEFPLTPFFPLYFLCLPTDRLLPFYMEIRNIINRLLERDWFGLSKRIIIFLRRIDCGSGDWKCVIRH